jgi:hypothetical protein
MELTEGIPTDLFDELLLKGHIMSVNRAFDGVTQSLYQQKQFPKPAYCFANLPISDNLFSKGQKEIGPLSVSLVEYDPEITEQAREIFNSEGEVTFTNQYQIVMRCGGRFCEYNHCLLRRGYTSDIPIEFSFSREAAFKPVGIIGMIRSFFDKRS